MGKKTRRRPFQCPVAGCPKRGLRADLIRHASALHPNVSRDAYISAIDRGAMLGSQEPRTGWRTIRRAVQALSLLLIVATLLWLAFAKHHILN